MRSASSWSSSAGPMARRSSAKRFLLPAVPGRHARHRRVRRLRHRPLARAQRRPSSATPGALHARGDRSRPSAEQARALVRAHRDAGDRVAIATSTNEFITRPIADAFGVTSLIATQLERDAAGPRHRAHPRRAVAARGQGAARQQWLQAEGLRLADFDASVFYSDAPTTCRCSSAVSEPVATNPSRRWRHRARAGLAYPEALRMIKRFIDKLLGKPAGAAGAVRWASASRCRRRARHRPFAGRRARGQGRQHAARSRPPGLHRRRRSARPAGRLAGRRTSTSPPMRRPSRSSRCSGAPSSSAAAFAWCT